MKLEIGYDLPFEIRRYALAVEQLAGLRIVYASDFHYNSRSRNRAAETGSTITRLQPDIVLLGGDYVDSPGGLSSLQHFLDHLPDVKYIIAVPGNHDWPYSRRIRMIVEKGRGTWLTQGSA